MIFVGLIIYMGVFGSAYRTSSRITVLILPRTVNVIASVVYEVQRRDTKNCQHPTANSAPPTTLFFNLDL